MRRSIQAPKTWAPSIELLLASRGIPILYEECESFIHNYLDLDEGTTNASRALFSRSILLFSTITVRLYSDGHFRFDEDYNNAFEKLLIESLSAPPSDVESPLLEWTDRPDDDLDRFNDGDYLRTDLALATMRVVARSGYVAATISRIARRADCSPAAIYKSHSSEEGLVVAAFIDILDGRTMEISDVADILCDDFLAPAMRRRSDGASQLKRDFTLELFVAAAHRDEIRKAIRRELTHLESSFENAAGLEDDGHNFAYMLRTSVTTLIGASWLSSLSGTAKQFDFAQFTEPLTQAMISQWLPDWQAMSHVIRDGRHANLA